MSKTLYLMRHGQTLFNVRRKIQGDCDSPLTELGKEQALIAKEYLKDIEFDAYYASTAERASDTLELIIGEETPYKRLKGLKERGFGVFEGESEDLHPTWENGLDTFYPRFGGETGEAVMLRMKETCINIMEQEAHNTVLAVSHSGASFHFIRNWTTQDQQDQIMNEGGFTNCCILKYEYKDKEFTFIEIMRPGHE